MRATLFRSDNLVVRRVGGHGGACCVVAFASFTDERTLDRPGFGEAFLDGAGVDAVHVLSRDNDWYQHAETMDAMACVRAAVAGYARVVTYGSSMGGYAAVRLAGLAGAHAVLALSPQFSIDPAVVPWEGRWRHRGAAFRPVWEGVLPFPEVAEAYVAYDPMDRDRKHVALFRAAWRFTAVRVPGGHPVTGFLAQVGLLQRAILEVCGGVFDVPAFEAAAAARVGESAQALMVLAERMPSWRREEKLALVRRAAAVEPGNADMASRAGRVFARAGLFGEALALHRQALAAEPGHPNLLLTYSYSLEGSGDVRGALVAMEGALAVAPEEPLYVARTAGLRGRVARRRAWWRRWFACPWRAPKVTR